MLSGEVDGMWIEQIGQWLMVAGTRWQVHDKFIMLFYLLLCMLEILCNKIKNNRNCVNKIEELK